MSPPIDRLIRIKPHQVLCTHSECCNPTTLMVHRFLGTDKPARLPYCEDHAKLVAKELGIPLLQ